MKKTKEWLLVEALIEVVEEMYDNQRDFIQGLFDHLDPYLPFLEQQSVKQLEYLHQLYDIYCNGEDYESDETDS